MAELEQISSFILDVASMAVTIINDVMGEALKDITPWDDKLGFTIGGLIGGLLLLVCIGWFVRFKIIQRKGVGFMVSEENGD